MAYHRMVGMPKLPMQVPGSSFIRFLSIFFPLIKYKIGEGSPIHFSEDLWKGNVFFSTAYLYPYHLSNLHNAAAYNFYILEANNISWDFHFFQES